MVSRVLEPSSSGGGLSLLLDRPAVRDGEGDWTVEWNGDFQIVI